jgi:cytochrome b pre-mRNA-processing protein 3
MISQWFKNRARRKQTAARLYHLALAQSREPVFYRDLAVADTMDGRFDLVCFHVAIVLSRLKDFGPGGAKLAQALFDHMFKQVEFALREIGVGDLGVPKHMQKMMKAFNGRAHMYEAALARKDTEALRDALSRNVYRADDAANAILLAEYGLACAVILAERTQAQIEAGDFSFAPILEEGLRKHA